MNTNPANTVVKKTMLVKVDTQANSNKFYELTLHADNSILCRFGRVGTTGSEHSYDGGETMFNSLLRGKERKGYAAVDVVSGTAQTGGQADLLDIAKTVLVNSKHHGDPQVNTLIEQLVKMNRHEILNTSGGLIQINAAGQISTPLGILQSGSITQARHVLDDIAVKSVHDVSRNELIERYLKLVPQKMPAKAGWQNQFLADGNAIAAQVTFLDQLRDSLTWYEAEQARTLDIARASQAGQPVDLANAYKDLFRVNISPMDPSDKQYRKIRDFYTMSKNAHHSSRHLKVANIYTLTSTGDDAEYEATAKRIGNEKLLWHGTRAFNLLSILRKGLFVPPLTGTSYQTTGRMFGDGVYFSDQSTKALNYSYGYWDRSNPRDNSCFMFLADVALGNEFRPKYFDHTSLQKAHYGHNRFGKAFNSISIKGGTCNVLNNELIVWDVSQIRLRFLVQFEE